MMVRLCSAIACLFALTVAPACSGDDPTPKSSTPAVETEDATIPKVPPSKVLVDAPQLVVDMTAVLAAVVDKATAVQARQTIEMQLRVLRKHLPGGNDNVQPRPTVFDSVLKGKEKEVGALRAQLDRIAKLPECEPILAVYITALRDLLV